MKQFIYAIKSCIISFPSLSYTSDMRKYIIFSDIIIIIVNTFFNIFINQQTTGCP